MPSHPTWERLRTGSRVSSVVVGPFRLIARVDSYTLAGSARGAIDAVRDVPAKNEAAARKGAIDAARAKLSEWAAELDALEHQDGGGRG